MSGYCKRPGCGRPCESRTDQCATHRAEDRKAERQALKEMATAIDRLAIRKFIPKRTEKRAEQEKIYNARVKIWIVGKMCAVFPKLKATQCHHRKGRWGKLLLDERYWLPVSQEGHDYIHDHPEWSRDREFMIPRSV